MKLTTNHIRQEDLTTIRNVVAALRRLGQHDMTEKRFVTLALMRYTEAIIGELNALEKKKHDLTVAEELDAKPVESALVSE